VHRSERTSLRRVAVGVFIATLGVGHSAHADDREGTYLLATAYDRKARGDESGAVEAFQAAREAGTQPQRIALELAYMYLARGDVKAARAELTVAAAGPDVTLAKQAQTQLDQFPGRWWADVYAESFGWSRIDGPNHSTDLVPTVRLRGLRRLHQTIDANAYVFAQATRDIASRGAGNGALPLIYADNSAMTGGGLLVRVLGGHLGLFAQIGPAMRLVDDGVRDAVQLDVRGGAVLSWASAACHQQGGIVEAGTWCAELYSEGVYTSRFNHDVQGFARSRVGFTYIETGPVSWQMYWELRAALDLNGDYYDNLIESGMGPRWRLNRPIRIDLLVGAHAGSYLWRENRDPAPANRQYVDARLLAATYVEF
jgi:hypothetical protein